MCIRTENIFALEKYFQNYCCLVKVIHKIWYNTEIFRLKKDKYSSLLCEELEDYLFMNIKLKIATST